MRKFDFEDESNDEIMDFQKVINILLIQNYTIDKISELINISRFNIDKILKYKYKVPVMNNEPKKYYSESDLTVGSSNYNYDNLSEIEKSIYNNLK